jgi:hypothetical protein
MRRSPESWFDFPAAGKKKFMSTPSKHKPSFLLLHDERSDYIFKASLRSEYGTVRKVLCSILLPKRVTEPVVMRFYPTARQTFPLQISPVFRVTGSKRYGGQASEILATDVWTTKTLITGHQGNIRFHSDFSAEAAELETRTYTGRKPRRITVEGGTFWLTPHPLVNAASILTRSFTGGIRVKLVTRPRFTLRTGVVLNFRNHYRYLKQENGETLSFSELVAEFRLKHKQEDSAVPNIIEDLDDWLLLASFAARQRCLCMGYEYPGTGVFVRKYRRMFSLPRNREISTNETLIDVLPFFPFMRRAYSSFGKYQQKDLLRKAVYPLTSDRDRTSESLFLALFSGLQSALLAVVMSTGYKSKRKWPEVKEGFTHFQTRYRVDFSDLWPLVDGSTGASLTQIRNKVVHGDYLTPAQEPALMYAQQHLRWTLERVLLAILGWPVDRSRAGRKFLSTNLLAHQDWTRHRKAFD